MKNQPGFMKKQPWTSKTNLEPWKSKTNLNPWKSVITDMEPWKTNLQPSKLTRSCTGWLWVVQVVTGDSKEEVLIFRDKQTLHHNIYIIISHPCHHGHKHYHLLLFGHKLIITELSCLGKLITQHTTLGQEEGDKRKFFFCSLKVLPYLGAIGLS